MKISMEYNQDGKLVCYSETNNEPTLLSKKNTRKLKGKSLLSVPNSYVVLDLETSGLNTMANDIIEIGMIKVVEREIVDTFESLVNPGYRISPFITQLITAPTIFDVMPKAQAFIGDSIVVAHNANFDINFMYDTCKKHKFPLFCNDFVDTMRLSRRLYPCEKHHRLKDLTERFGVTNESEHRALSDVLATNSCLLYMQDYIDAQEICVHSLK